LEAEIAEAKQPGTISVDVLSDSADNRRLLAGLAAQVRPAAEAVEVAGPLSGRPPLANSKFLPAGLRTIDGEREASSPATGSKLALFQAIVEPNIWTAPVDRERGIVLRWALRDIRGNRLGLLPVDQTTLQTLVELSLIEISDGNPLLTSKGFDAIAST
jgi:hypothetical protein